MSTEANKRFDEAFARLSPADQEAARVQMGCYGQCVIKTMVGNTELVDPRDWFWVAPRKERAGR